MSDLNNTPNTNSNYILEVEELKKFEKERIFSLSEELQNSLLSRTTWDDAVKELQGLLTYQRRNFTYHRSMMKISCVYKEFI